MNLRPTFTGWMPMWTAIDTMYVTRSWGAQHGNVRHIRVVTVYVTWHQGVQQLPLIKLPGFSLPFPWPSFVFPDHESHWIHNTDLLAYHNCWCIYLANKMTKLIWHQWNIHWIIGAWHPSHWCQQLHQQWMRMLSKMFKITHETTIAMTRSKFPDFSQHF